MKNGGGTWRCTRSSQSDGRGPARGNRGSQAPPAAAGQTEPDPDITITGTEPDVHPASQRKTGK